MKKLLKSIVYILTFDKLNQQKILRQINVLMSSPRMRTQKRETRDQPRKNIKHYLKLGVAITVLLALASCVTTDQIANKKTLLECLEQFPEPNRRDHVAEAYMCAYDKAAAKIGKLWLLPDTHMQEHMSELCQEDGSKSINDIVYCTEINTQKSMISWLDRKDKTVTEAQINAMYRDKIIKWEERTGKVKAMVIQPCLKAEGCMTMVVMTPEQARKGLETGQVTAILSPMKQRMVPASDAGNKIVEKINETVRKVNGR